MSSLTIASIIFACVFGGAMLGMMLRALLPEHHLGAESKDVIKVGTGLIGTMAALVLGLLVASAKSSYDATRSEVIEMARDVALLDRILAHYGPAAGGAREQLRRMVEVALTQLWTEGASTAASAAPRTTEGEKLYDQIQQLAPANDAQRAIVSQAQSICTDLGKTRLLLSAQHGRSISLPLLIVLVLWQAVVFVSFGVFAPRNATVIITLLICALSVSIAMFLILEMDHPFAGVIRLSDAPVRNCPASVGIGELDRLGYTYSDTRRRRFPWPESDGVSQGHRRWRSCGST